MVETIHPEYQTIFAWIHQSVCKGLQREHGVNTPLVSSDFLQVTVAFLAQGTHITLANVQFFVFDDCQYCVW